MKEKVFYHNLPILRCSRIQNCLSLPKFYYPVARYVITNPSNPISLHSLYALFKFTGLWLTALNVKV